jgi:acid phosphatase type 7
MHRARWRAAAAGLTLSVAAACGDSRGPGGPDPPPPPPPITTGTLVGAGDIAICGRSGASSTADLLDLIDGTVFTAGDNAYFQGTAEQFAQCYDPTWGRHKGRTRPSPGNHEYESPGAGPYFDYFGPNAGPRGLGYYSFETGPWHIVSLNSSVAAGEGSPQMMWLRGDLANTNARCVAAIWHHPVFSSGQNGPASHMREVFRVLRELGADVVINGHDHMYERFARQDENGRSTSGGLRQFTVGTGGADLTSMARMSANSEVRFSVHGVLKLTLSPESYSWQFVAVPPSSVVDSGSDTCR